jgi:hypothetical protein
MSPVPNSHAPSGPSATIGRRSPPALRRSRRKRTRPQTRFNGLWPQEVRAFRESGHAVARHYFGHKIVEVKAGSDAEAGCWLAGGQDVEPRDFIVGCCAGKAAVDQAFGKAGTDDNWLCSNDHADAFKVALHVSDGDAQAAELLVKWGQQMADVLCVRRWPQPAVMFCVADCISRRHPARNIRVHRTAAHRKLDRRRRLCAGGLRKRASLIASAMRHSITERRTR